MPKRIGERYRSRPVATAVAKHLMMAFASVEVSFDLSKRRGWVLTFIDRGNDQTYEDVAHDNHEGSRVAVACKEARFVALEYPVDDMDDQVHSGTGRIQNHVIHVQGCVLTLVEFLIVDSRDGADDGHADEEEVGGE